MDRDRHKQTKPRKARPIPARMTEGKREGKKKAPDSSPPLAARPPKPASPTPEVAPDVESVTLDVDGSEWIVRVEGRSRTRGQEGAASLLLLRFRAEAKGDEPEREALVVGRTLSALTPAQLEAAFRIARRPPDPNRSREIFAGTSTRGGRGS